MSPRARRERRQRTREAARAGRSPAPDAAGWLGAPAGLLVAGVMVFALGLRVYYFTVTKDQPLWWDEAEYMLKAKALALGTPDTGWWEARPILLSFAAAGLLRAGLGEVTVRVLWLLLSATGLALIYGIAGRLLNKRIGVVAVALASASYLDVFYSMRLLVDAPQVFFATLAAFLLAVSLDGDHRRSAAWGVVPALVVGTALRFTAAIFFPIVAVFLLAVKGRALLRTRAWWISVGLGVGLALLDGDLDHAATVEPAARAQRAGESLGGQPLIGR